MKLKYGIPFLAGIAVMFFVINQVFMPAIIVSAEGDSGNGTIAGVEITEKKKSAIKAQIADEVGKWKEQDIEVAGATATTTIPSDLIQFDIDQTVDQYVKASSAHWYKFWAKKKPVDIPLEVTVDEQAYALLQEAPFFYVDETMEALKEHARFLRRGAVQAEEVPFLKEDMKRVSFEIQEVVVDGHGISQIVDVLDEMTIADGETFSFLGKLDDVNSFYSEETADFVASVLYSVVLQSELDITERHSQNRLPSYLQPGIEAKVNTRRNLDFSFMNRSTRPYVISASLEGGRLKVGLYSFQSPYEVEVDIIERETIEPRTIYRLTSELAAGRQRVLEQGKAGLRVNVYKRMTEPGGVYEEDKLISQDFYPPKHKVVLVSSLEPPTTTPSEGASPSTENSSVKLDSDEEEEKETTSSTGHNSENTQEDEHENKGQNELKNEEQMYDKGGNLIEPEKN